MTGPSPRQSRQEEKEEESVKKRERETLGAANDDERIFFCRVFFSVFPSQFFFFFTNLSFSKKTLPPCPPPSLPAPPCARSSPRCVKFSSERGLWDAPSAGGESEGIGLYFVCFLFLLRLSWHLRYLFFRWNPPRGRLAALARLPSSRPWTPRSDVPSFARRKGLERRNWRRSELAKSPCPFFQA